MSAVMQGLTTVGVLEEEAVVIQGAGGLGLSATAIAKDMGAHPIIVLDRLEPRLRLAAGVRRRLHHQRARNGFAGGAYRAGP